MSDIICTSECVHCVYCNLHDADKSRVKVFCKLKDKTYYYGQKVVCENYTKKNDEEIKEYEDNKNKN